MAKPGFFTNRSIDGIPLGINVHKQFNKQFIFQTRRGNGSYGSVLGKVYHDKKAYSVPSSINNVEGQAARDLLATAVSNWQGVLSDPEKAGYNKRASKGLNMSGYNLYIRECILANI